MSILAANPRVLYREVYHNRDHQQQLWSGGVTCCCLSLQRTERAGFANNNSDCKKISRRNWRAQAFWPETSPTSVEMEPINDCDHLDQILLHAQDLSQPIIIDWMASWCRKCIYLKPKLEKLGAEYDTKIKFYCVDVNKVPQALVKRGNISKMPTIQLWKDREMKAEVIGGHKAWLVIQEVREMIQKFV